VSDKDNEGTIIEDLSPMFFIDSGSVLNPAIAFGTMLISLDFKYFLQYIVMPLVGGMLGFLFHEFIFMRTQEAFKLDDQSNMDWDA
jgi:hypothetical protein